MAAGNKAARIAAAIAALAAWSGLALQYWLLAGSFADEGRSALAAAWRFLGYFTILTNLAVAIVATAMAVRPEARIAGPRARLAVAAAIALVGIVYSLALRHVWSPTGAQAVADHLLHDASPPLFLLAWALAGHGGLKWRDAWWALPLPGGYFLYGMARGAAEDWYAYWFLDPASLPAAQFAGNIVLLLAACGAMGAVMVAVDRWLGRKKA